MQPFASINPTAKQGKQIVNPIKLFYVREAKTNLKFLKLYNLSN